MRNACFVGLYDSQACFTELESSKDSLNAVTLLIQDFLNVFPSHFPIRSTFVRRRSSNVRDVEIDWSTTKLADL